MQDPGLAKLPENLFRLNQVLRNPPFLQENEKKKMHSHIILKLWKHMLVLHKSDLGDLICKHLCKIKNLIEKQD